MAKLTKKAAEQLRAHLADRPLDELVELLVEQASRDAALRDRLLIEAAKSSAGGVDIASFRRSLNDALFSFRGGRGWPRTSGGWAYEMHDAITRLDELLGAGQAAAVVEVAEYTLDRVSKAMGEVDDSSGYFSDIVAGLEDIHLRASVAAKPDPVALARRLFVKEVDAEWDIFVDLVPRYADVLGDAGLEEFRRLADERWAGVKPVGPGEKDDERYGRRYRITRIMERLAEHDGDIDRLVEVKSRNLSMPYDWLQIAETLAAVGRHDEALSWAGRGVAAFPDQHDARLDEFLCDEYHRHGRPDDALMLTWERFQASPSLTTYQRLADHAARAEAWDDWRPNAIAILRRHVDAARRPAVSTQTKARSRGFRDFAPAGVSVLVEVLLWEGDSDSAWSEAQGGGFPSDCGCAWPARARRTTPMTPSPSTSARWKRSLAPRRTTPTPRRCG